jgi:hypothetical protein
MCGLLLETPPEYRPGFLYETVLEARCRLRIGISITLLAVGKLAEFGMEIGELKRKNLNAVFCSLNFVLCSAILRTLKLEQRSKNKAQRST